MWCWRSITQMNHLLGAGITALGWERCWTLPPIEIQISVLRLVFSPAKGQKRQAQDVSQSSLLLHNGRYFCSPSLLTPAIKNQAPAWLHNLILDSVSWITMLQTSFYQCFIIHHLCSLIEEGSFGIKPPESLQRDLTMCGAGVVAPSGQLLVCFPFHIIQAMHPREYCLVSRSMKDLCDHNSNVTNAHP